MFRSTQRRLALWYTAITALLLLVFASGFFFYVRITLVDRVDDTLSHVIEVVTRSLVVEPQRPEQINWQISLGSNPIANAALEEDHIDLEGFSPTQDLRWSTFSEPLNIPLNLTKVAQTVRIPGDRSLAQDDRDDDRWLRQMTTILMLEDRVIGYLRVSHPWFEVTRPSQDLLLELGIGLLVMVTLVGISGWFLSRLAMEPIRESYAYLKQFSADVSHELRNPIALIQTNVQVALAQGDPVQQQQQLQVIERLTRRLGRLVDDLLFLVRQDSGVIPQTWEWCPLDALLMAVLEEQGAIAAAKGIKLSLDIGDAPTDSPDTAFLIQGNGDHLSRMLSNLISNALQYTPSGGQVSLSLKATGQSYEFCCKDSGPGIPTEALPHLFDRFYRWNQTSSEGTGLGLAIAQSIAHEHRGQISVDSQMEQGTTFLVTLPY
ncbi:HAMP domain-containing histidine kinase [Candidatus Synechococcus calcipolaris G9]|uniref:histidine kinase n=1 Tax=Candidatus Synechococcus calcipolaris G9 TaxID=1497997 RepID=A0ABT6EY06_9SYNE|nr:HAMP domain-containing sensor histidine kinase [Candidatus Synechococcus calcipolaris]MDG2989780.1 HAMP domain-containing histidine kinase [Candidatus Synechococcus calcipolaris G9]